MFYFGRHKRRWDYDIVSVQGEVGVLWDGPLVDWWDAAMRLRYDRHA